MTAMNPKLRQVESQWVQAQGRSMLQLRDPLGLSDKMILVPEGLVPLLMLCDGSRDIPTLAAALALRTGQDLGATRVSQLVDQLDDALVLDSQHFRQTRAEALAEYRALPFRPPALAGLSYPDQPEPLREMLAGYVAQVADGIANAAPLDGVAGLISPHIDYHRGGPVYARAWQAIAPALSGAELVIIFGTDHAGGLGQLTPTRQHYATPFGLLPTALPVVDALAAALGEEGAFAEELHHRREHSIELAAVWLQFVLREQAVEIVPILCGSFQHFASGAEDPASDERIERAIAALRGAIAGRRTLVVAAADLAHVGPTFGDPSPFGGAARAALREADTALLAAACTGDAEAFFAPLRNEGDRRRVCGLPPIYLMLRLLDGARGKVVGYAQCPADENDGSWVSIGGVAFGCP